MIIKFAENVNKFLFSGGPGTPSAAPSPGFPSGGGSPYPQGQSSPFGGGGSGGGTGGGYPNYPSGYYNNQTSPQGSGYLGGPNDLKTDGGGNMYSSSPSPQGNFNSPMMYHMKQQGFSSSPNYYNYNMGNQNKSSDKGEDEIINRDSSDSSKVKSQMKLPHKSPGFPSSDQGDHILDPNPPKDNKGQGESSDSLQRLKDLTASATAEANNHHLRPKSEENNALMDNLDSIPELPDIPELKFEGSKGDDDDGDEGCGDRKRRKTEEKVEVKEDNNEQAAFTNNNNDINQHQTDYIMQQQGELTKHLLA